MSEFGAPKLSYRAGGTINPGTFVTLNDDFQVVASGTGDTPAGVSAQGTRRYDATSLATSGEQLAVYGPSQRCYLLCGGSVTAGDKLKPDANAAAVTASSTNKFGAVAQEDGTTGAMIIVEVQNGTV